MARILIAEDDDAVREFVSRALALQGHKVTAVTDGGQALEAMQAERYDLLLTDIVMPGMDGIALALRVTRDYPDVPILLMTGYAAERQRVHNLDALISRVLLKPFTLKEVCSAVAEVLAETGARQRRNLSLDT